MFFGMPGAKDVLIKNLTGEELQDINLIFEGIEKYPLRISKIKKDRQVVKTLVLSYLNKVTELKLCYYKEGQKQEMVVYNELSKKDLRKLILEISKENGELKVRTSIEEKYI